MKALYKRFCNWCYEHTDKVLHFTATLLLCLALCAVTGMAWVGFLITLAVGAAKEWLYDARQPDNHADWQDMAANTAGAVTGLLVFWAVGLFAS